MFLEKKNFVPKGHKAKQRGKPCLDEISEESQQEASNCHSSKMCKTIIADGQVMQKIWRETPIFYQFKVVIQKFDQELYKLNKFNIKVKSCDNCSQIVSPCQSHMVNDNGQTFPVPVSSLAHQNQMKDEEEQRFGSSFRTFVMSRLQNSEGKKIDLSYCTLNQLIEYCKQENIMNDKTYNRFHLNNPPCVEKIFLEQFQFQTKMVLNFKFQLFALIDHRLFSQLLCLKNPQKYFKSLDYPIVYDKEAIRFLKRIYNVPYSKYMEDLQNFNEKYERFWMPKPETDLNGFKFDVIVCDGADFHRTTKNGRFLRERRAKNLMEDQSQI